MKVEKSNIITLTDIAVEKLKNMIESSCEEDGKLRISLELDGVKMFYNMEVTSNLLEGDKLYNINDLLVVINEEDVELLTGLIIDYISDEEGEGFILDNPNIISELQSDDSSGGCGCGCGYC